MKLTIILLLISHPVYAEIPFIFTAKTPAKASEVNDNYKYLDDKLDTLNSKLTDKCSDPLDRIAFTYEKKLAPLGTTFTLGFDSFVLIKSIFIDIVSGDRYTITFPAIGAPWTTVTHRIIDPTQFCSTATISGFPSNNDRLNVSSEITYYAAYSSNRIRYTVLKNVEILVGSTVLSFDIKASVHPQDSVYIDDVNFDYTQKYNYDFMGQPNALIQQVDDLLDYIDIVKVP